MFMLALESRRLFASGLFSAPMSYGDGRVWMLATGDFNGDGSADVAALVSAPIPGPAVPLPCSLQVLLNDGTGHFASSSVALGEGVPAGLSAADLNDDEVDDLAVLLRPGATGAAPLRILYGAAGGAPVFAEGATLTGPAGILPEVPDPTRVAARDFDRDGRGDLLLDSLVVSRAGGAWNVEPSPASGAVATSPDAAVGDFNGDGRDDQVLGAWGGAAAAGSLLLSRPDGTYLSALFSMMDPLPTAYAAGDFNADGTDDVAAASLGESTLNAFLGRGDGTFHGVGTEAAGGFGVTSLAAADFDADGRDDLVAGTDGHLGGRTIHVLTTFAPPERAVLGRFGGTPTGPVRSVTIDGFGAEFSPPPRVTFALGGPGSGTLYDTGPANPPALVLEGTTAASSLKISTAGKARHVLSAIEVNGSLASIAAPTTGFGGPLNVAGTVRSIRMYGAFFGRIDIGGEGVATAINLGDTRETSLTTRSPISRLAVAQWVNRDGVPDAITAPAIGSISARRTAGFKDVDADFNADVNVTGGGVSLGQMHVGRSLGYCTIRTAGSIGSVRAGAMMSVSVFAGVSPAVRGLPASAADFAARASIGSVRADTDLGSGVFVAAWSVGSFRVDGESGVNEFTHNTPVPFGLAATSVQSYARGTGPARVRKLRLTSPGVFDTDGFQYVARIVPAES